MTQLGQLGQARKHDPASWVSWVMLENMTQLALGHIPVNPDQGGKVLMGPDRWINASVGKQIVRSSGCVSDNLFRSRVVRLP